MKLDIESRFETEIIAKMGKMAREEPKDVNIYSVKGYIKCHVVLFALDKRT